MLHLPPQFKEHDHRLPQKTKWIIFLKKIKKTNETGPEEHTREGDHGEFCLRLYRECARNGVFTSDMHLCLTFGGTMFRRGERPSRRH